MTALSEYARLETTGLWRETPDSQRREVVVSLGDATLVISTITDSALSHWSLPAVHRLNPGKRPALYAPDTEADEMLEISEPQMIEAIERVRSAIERARPHPGRLRLWLAAFLTLITIFISVVWLPDALIRQTASLLPAAKRDEMGQLVLAGMADLAGRPCADSSGVAAMRDLSRAVFGAGAPRIVVLPSTAQSTAALPGNIIVVNRSLVEDYEGPEVLAGFLLTEALRRDRADPVVRLLEEAGLLATFRLLTTGEINPAHLRTHAATLLTTALVPVDTAALLTRFELAGISTEPFAYALDMSGESVLHLIEADPMRGRLRAPLMSDQDWIALQGICGG
tara:strand:+ start:63 stop:1079 length:1017 start_codon:yes stop_codon:yes gene_type:complete